MTISHFKFNLIFSFVTVKSGLLLLYLALHWLEIAWFVKSLWWTCTWPSTFQFSHFYSSHATTISEEKRSREYWSALVLYTFSHTFRLASPSMTVASFHATDETLGTLVLTCNVPSVVPPLVHPPWHKTDYYPKYHNASYHRSDDSPMRTSWTWIKNSEVQLKGLFWKWEALKVKRRITQERRETGWEMSQAIFIPRRCRIF